MLHEILGKYSPKLQLESHAIKLQINEGAGGCFPIHNDTADGLDERRLTAIWYLNPDWKQGDGGELRLYPWPRETVDVAPINDRLVLFSSARLHHRCARERRGGGKSESESLF